MNSCSLCDYRQICCVGSFLVRLQIAKFVFGVRDSKQHIAVAFY